MSNKEENPSLTGYYSMEKFIKELKKISGLPENFEGSDDIQKNNQMQSSLELNNTYLSPYTKNRFEKLKVGNSVISKNTEINSN